jgi:YD repeat-containing protein
MTSLKVINTSVTTYNESWPTDQHGLVADSTQVGSIPTILVDHAVSDPNRCPDGFFNSDTNTPLGPPYNGSAAAQLNNSGIWPIPVTDNKFNQPVDVEADFDLTAGDWQVGYSGDSSCQYYIDGVELNIRPTRYWCLQTVHLVGTHHHLSLRTTNTDNTLHGAMGLVIYYNGGFSPAFTTASLAGQPVSEAPVYRKSINPYVRGFLGNWRELSTNVFQQSRHYNTNAAVKGVEVKDVGYINNFSSYWYQGAQPGWVTDQAGNRARWVTANTVTAYDQYGQQLENRDALNRFSAALFGFNGELPVAVASNSMNREIYSNGFEDGQFTTGSAGYPDRLNEFKKTGTSVDIRQLIVPDASHSGNYSVSLPAEGITLTTNVYSQTLGTTGLTNINQYGEYGILSTPGLYPNGFEPSPTKQYIFDVWVKDGHPTDKTVNLQLNAASSSVTLTCRALVEDWKLLEGTISVPSNATSLTISLTPSSAGMYIDDIRIHPKDAQMKTYVYDDKTMRLMAEIDENGFATFYEYDDEGLLIRVKKETERGVMTIKESRSSYKKGS